MEQSKNINLLNNQKDLQALCKFCHRKLKNPVYVALGYGSCCAKKNNINISVRKKPVVEKIKSHSVLDF